MWIEDEDTERSSFFSTEEGQNWLKNLMNAFSINKHIKWFFGVDAVTPNEGENKDDFLERRAEAHQRGEETIEQLETVIDVLDMVVPYSSLLQVGLGIESNNMDAIWAAAPFALLDIAGGGAGKAIKKLPLKGLSVKNQAKTISHYIRKNTVIVDTPNVRYFYDLRGTPHKDIETPHIQRAFKNIDPKGKVHWNKDRNWVKPMTQKDIRIVTNILERR